MRAHYTDTVDKAVCTEESGASRLEAVLVALVERKARALHAEQSRTHPLLLLLRHLPDEETSIIGSPSEELPSHWCEHEIARHKRKKLKLQTQRNKERGPEQQEVDRRRKRRRRRKQAPDQPPRKHRTLLVSAIDEQAKVIHVLDPDELPRRARYTIMVTACLLLFLCLLLVGVTLRMAPLIDDMGRRQGGAAAARGGRRGRLLLRAGAGLGAGGGGHTDAQLGAPRAQPNGQVLHVLRAAAPSSHAAGERAHDARRPAGGSLKSHPVVGGIALTPRYSPRPRLDNIRPAAAPPEPVESEPPPDPRPEPRLGALLAVSHPTLLQPLWTLGKSASTTSQSAGQHTTTSPNPERAVSLAASALPVLQSTLEMSTHSISTLSSPHGHALLLALTQPASAPSTPVSPSTETKSVVSMLYSPVQDVSDTSTLQDSALAVSDLPTTQISLQLSSVSSPS